MATWTTIPSSLVVAGKPVTASLMAALRENPEAIAEGASGAPRVMLAALPELVAGSTIRARAADVTTTSASYVTAASFTFLQRGVVRATFEHLTDNNTRDSEAAIVRSRAGTLTTLQTWSTNSLTAVFRSVDVTVRVGDLLLFQHRIGSPATSTMQTMRLRTDGGDLWPSLDGGGLQVEGNTA